MYILYDIRVRDIRICGYREYSGAEAREKAVLRAENNHYFKKYKHGMLVGMYVLLYISSVKSLLTMPSFRHAPGEAVLLRAVDPISGGVFFHMMRLTCCLVSASSIHPASVSTSYCRTRPHHFPTWDLPLLIRLVPK